MWSEWAAGLMLGVALVCAAPASAEAPEGRGNNTAEARSTQAPVNPRGFGSVTSQRAADDHDIGEHASGQDEPRLGVGNVAANDGGLAQVAGVPDSGTRPSDHGAVVGALSGYDPAVRPGTH